MRALLYVPGFWAILGALVYVAFMLTAGSLMHRADISRRGEGTPCGAVPPPHYTITPLEHDRLPKKSGNLS